MRTLTYTSLLCVHDDFQYKSAVSSGTFCFDGSWGFSKFQIIHLVTSSEAIIFFNFVDKFACIYIDFKLYQSLSFVK